MHDVKSNIKIAEHLAAVSRTAGAANGTGIDLGEFTNASFLISAGTFGTDATLDAKLQDSADNSTWADVTADTYNDGAMTQMTEAGSARLHLTKPLKRYVRVVLTVGTAAVVAAVVVVLGGAKHKPVSYS